jgi:MFS family permease
MRRALRVPGVGLLLAGQTLSMFGDRALLLVLAIWAKTLTGSSAAAAMVVFVVVAPALFAPIGGLVVDRLRRRSVMIAVDLVVGVGVLALLFVDGPGQLWLLYAVAAMYGAGGMVFESAQSALLTTMLPEEMLPEANGAFQTVREGLRIVAPIAGAALFAAFGGGAVAVVDASTFAVSAVCLAFLPGREPKPAKAEHHVLREAAAGVRHVLATLPLRRIVLTTAVALLVVGFAETVIFAVVDQGLHRPPSFVGVLGFVQGIGAVAGGLTAAWAIRRLGDARVTAAGIGLFAIGDAGLASAVLPVVMLGIMVAGFGIAWLVVAFVTAVQRRTPAALQGRAFSAADAMVSVPQTISIAAGAALSLVLDYRILVAVMSTVTLSAAVWLAVRGRVRPEVTAAGDFPAAPEALVLVPSPPAHIVSE